MKKTTSRLIALTSVLVLLGLAPPVVPKKYHVSTRGSDSNPGTAAQPFKTIQRAVNVAMPGDSLFVHAGTYPEIVIIRKSGREDGRIVLIGAGDGVATVSPRLPVVACAASSPTRDRAIQILEGSDYWTVRGLTIEGGILVTGTNVAQLDPYVKDRTLPGRGVYDPVAASQLLPLLGSNGADYNRIVWNKITGRGVLTTAARYGRIRYNEISNIACGTGSGVWIGRFSDGWFVRENHVHDVANSGEDNHPMSEGIRQVGGSAYNQILNNLVEDLGGDGRGVTVDVYASWNVMRGNVVRRAAQGLNEQGGGWGNQWLYNRAESNRKFGLNINGKNGDLVRPDDSVPAGMIVRCNVTTGSGTEELHIGAVQQSTFATNAFSTAFISPRLRDYWANVGNTWDGNSQPPSETPREKFCG